MGQLQFKNLPCARWRYDDPADTMRFYALRLRDGGLIKTVTNELIEQGTDWRFLYEIRRELKS